MQLQPETGMAHVNQYYANLENQRIERDNAYDRHEGKLKVLVFSIMNV